LLHATLSAKDTEHLAMWYVPLMARRRKHGIESTLPSGKRIVCDGRLRTLYARGEDGVMRSVGSVCTVCLELQLDVAPARRWHPVDVQAPSSNGDVQDSSE
jgi:hypothetical protein